MFRRASDCCKTHYTEEPSEFDGVQFTPVCAACHRPCKIITVGEDEGTPRSQAQAEADAKANPDPEVKLKVGDGIKALQAERNQTPVEAPETPSNEFKVKDGLIYQGDTVIGKALSDKELYKSKYGEEWQGSDEALKKVLHG